VKIVPTSEFAFITFHATFYAAQAGKPIKLPLQLRTGVTIATQLLDLRISMLYLLARD